MGRLPTSRTVKVNGPNCVASIDAVSLCWFMCGFSFLVLIIFIFYVCSRMGFFIVLIDFF